MAEVYGYFNGLEYDEKFPMMRVASLIPTGVYNDSLHVSAGTGLTVYVAAGKAWVNGYFYSSDATKQITIDIADADNTRKDIIVLRLDTVNQLMTVAYKKGNPSVYPTPPTLQRNNDQYELQLAEILVPAGSASISAATITDTRSDSGLCGITAGFQGLDVAGLTAQAQAKFDIWFSNLKNQLDTNQAGNLQNQIDAINSSKGKAGGLMGLPTSLFASGKVLKSGTSPGEAAAAVFDDFATGVQSGSNGSSHWIKWPDGTMICQMDTDISSWTTGSYGKYASLNFPQAFSSSPYFVSSFPFLKGGIQSYPNWSNNYPKISHEALSNAAVTMISTGTDDFFVHILAIGRWKA